MSERPSQKLKLSMKVPKSEHSPPPPPSDTTPTTGPSIKLKFVKKAPLATPARQPHSPSVQIPSTTKPKPARKPKPTPKKRALEEDPLTSSNDEEPLASTSALAPAKKKIKFNFGGAHDPTPPPSATRTKSQLLKMKTKGRVPKRPRGVGYDSEASDCEEDPMITEAIILRMAPGPDCDYLRSAVAAGNLGLTTNTNAGADIRLRFLRSDGRRACIKIRENYYAAILVDLPCVIEAMKSWFPKTMGWMKSADICQMLLVLGKIGSEEDALEYPLPKGAFDEKTWQWAHGLTPPMHWVRKRRFRKRISVRTVMEVEAEVEEMLRLDALCEGAPIIEDIYEHPNRGNNSDQVSDDEGDENGYEDAEGEFIDDQNQVPATPLDTNSAAEDEEAAHARMAEEYEREMMLASTTIDPPLPPTSTSTTTNPPPSDSPATPTPRPSSPSSSSASSSPSSDSSTEENLTSDQKERAQEMQKLKEEIRDLDELIKAERGKLEATGNQLLRRRVVERIRGLVQDRELKVAGME